LRRRIQRGHGPIVSDKEKNRRGNKKRKKKDVVITVLYATGGKDATRGQLFLREGWLGRGMRAERQGSGISQNSFFLEIALHKSLGGKSRWGGEKVSLRKGRVMVVALELLGF